MDDDAVRELGPQVLDAAARSDLRALTAGNGLEHQQVDVTGGRPHLVEGGSFFVASSALVLPDMLDRITPGPRPYGVFVIVPHRHLLGWHLMTGRA